MEIQKTIWIILKNNHFLEEMDETQKIDKHKVSEAISHIDENDQLNFDDSTQKTIERLIKEKSEFDEGIIEILCRAEVR